MAASQQEKALFEEGAATESMTANIGATGNPGYDQGEMVEINLDEGHDHDDEKEKKEKNDWYGDDMESDEENSNNREEDEMSGSFQDDEPSTVDLAEKREQQVKQSLLFAFLSAIGMIFCMNMIGRLIERCSRSGGEDTGADDAVQAVAAGQDYAANTANSQAM